MCCVWEPTMSWKSDCMWTSHFVQVSKFQVPILLWTNSVAHFYWHDKKTHTDSGTRAIVFLFQLVLRSSFLQPVSCESCWRDTDSKTNKQFFLVQAALLLSKVHHGLEGGRVSYGSAVVDTKGRRLTGLSHTSGRRSLQYCNVDTRMYTQTDK